MESIYNNSQNVSSNSTSEYTSYLKKSELPKNVSAFKNDAGYISSNALNEWLRNHSYISKEEIESLIRNANITVIDSVQNTSDSEAIRRLEEYDTLLRGEIVEIKNKLSDLGADKGFITSDKEPSFATKNEINNVNNNINDIRTSISRIEEKSQNYITEHQSLEDYAKKTELTSYTKKTELSGYVKNVELTGYAKKTDLSDYTKKTDLNDYATKTDLSGYAKTGDLNDLKSRIPSLEGIASQEWVKGQKYLKSHQSLDGYAKKSDLNNYAKTSDLSVYAKETDVYTQSYIDDEFLSKDDASVIYITNTNVKDKYLAKRDAANIYLKIEDYIGLQDATTISEEYKNKTIDELRADLEYIMSGFYIVNQTDVVIVKDHALISIFNDGVQHGIDGEDGKSAYDIAVDNGFAGTEQEWILSLKGENGNDGIDGSDGEDGEDGKSAYDIAVDNGFTGTEQEWILSLKGENGNDGSDGEDGKSAYDIAVDNGFTGTEQEWLETLKVTTPTIRWKIL